VSVRLTDVTLRDGMHPLRHRFTVDQVLAITRALVDAGVPVIEISHGDGLGGSSLIYGRSLVDEHELIRAAEPIIREAGAKLSVLLLPGIATCADLEQAAAEGATVARIATHCTEADLAAEQLGRARELGMEAIGFLMMAHMAEPDELAEQALIQESAGAQVVYCTDTAGALAPPTVAARISTMREALDPATTVGFHGHNNLGLAAGNTIRAIEEGAGCVDASLRGLGAGAGNCATEALAAALDRLGWGDSLDVMALSDAAEELVAPLPDREPIVDRASLIMGWSGVGNSFLLHARHAAERSGVSEADILLEAGRRRVVSGQEDVIIDIARELSAREGG
jgi:4-hydroxy 2-oxovalerate aldolase